MELNQLEALVAIADCRSFSQAATQLYISQPAISRRIGVLEQELEVTLFERLPSGVSLTEAGESFLPFARQALAAVKDSQEAMQQFKQTVRGTVKLAMVGTLANTDLTDKLHRFKQKHPDLKLLLHTARSKEVSHMVQNGEVHFGLRYFDDAAPHLESLVVGAEQLVVACSAEFAVVPTKPLVAQLSETAWVSFPLDKRSSGEPYARALHRQLVCAGLAEVELITIDSLTAQKRLIEAGFGVGLLPLSSIQEEVRLGSVQVLDVPELVTTAPIVLVRRKTGYLPLGATSLLREFTTSLTEETG